MRNSVFGLTAAKRMAFATSAHTRKATVLLPMHPDYATFFGKYIKTIWAYSDLKKKNYAHMS